ncbi:MAG TPA: hypothetical protein VMI56_27590 [Reyranella sp.]|nr:hypothetical protein [Reyranella sp.]
MRNFLYRCPATKLIVQGTIQEGDYEGQTFVTQSCVACGGFHLVDPLTGQGPQEARLQVVPRTRREHAK